MFYCLYLYVIAHVLLYCIVFYCVLTCFAYDLLLFALGPANFAQHLFYIAHCLYSFVYDLL